MNDVHDDLPEKVWIDSGTVAWVPIPGTSFRARFAGQKPISGEYIRADLYQSQAERIAELEQKNSEMFGELNRQELAIRDLRLRNQELREKGLTQK